ncbi:MAG: rRNA maturation RNase YbeY [Acidobacteria bacterium]|nr:rRNA maturation RNase YbeY [Acidobacteriota bacterium]
MIVNLQRKVKLEARGYAGFLAEALAAIEEAEGGEAAVAFVSDRRMRELNKLFRGKDATTDVLSFPHEPDDFEVQSASFSSPDAQSASFSSSDSETLTTDDRQPPAAFLGDIVISAEQAARQAAAARLPLELEIKQLILHGLLHLCGYDHETDTGEMNARELALRNKLAIE